MNKYLYAALISLASSLLTLSIGTIAVVFYIILPFNKEAVDRGFARWEVTDNATGATKFAWNELATALHPENPDKFFSELEKPIEEINKGKN